ncbi:cysteine protease, putative [Medicago truncatula]|uniref:Cysteine protease, putative n=1 Tax=Medicago truncatula TaxID=3880 RepID=A0A072V5A7_MEDTR|nr:cysteine protease, putative [Medicago truncatula]
MTIFMSLEYSCLRICNVDDAKIIVIDWICTCSKLIFQPESNKHRTKTGNQKHTAQRREIKTNRVVQRRRNHKNKRKKTENM